MKRGRGEGVGSEERLRRRFSEIAKICKSSVGNLKGFVRFKVLKPRIVKFFDIFWEFRACRLHLKGFEQFSYVFYRLQTAWIGDFLKTLSLSIFTLH